MNKKFLLTLIIILLILVCIILVVLVKIKNTNVPSDSDYNINMENQNNIITEEPTIKEEHTPNIETINENVSNIYSQSELLDVKQCIDLFLYECSIKGYSNSENLNIYSMLDKEYINTYELTEENINDMLSEYYDDFEYIIKSMYKLNISTNVDLYITYGDLINTNEETKQSKSFMINMDKSNLAFSIFLDNYVAKNNYLENDISTKKVSDFKCSKEIENNINNTYKKEDYTTMDYISYYFNIYNLYLKYSSDGVYNILNTEYREKRFGNMENMNTFINNNKSKLINQMIFKYTEMNEDNYTQYVGIDGNGRYYIIQVDSLNNFSMFLDTYTVDLPEFLEKYNEADEQLKVKMNINRFFEAIKLNDYKYAYTKLDDSFKAQYFSTFEEFENYAKTNLIYEDEVEYNEFSDLEGVYTYTVELTNGENIVEKTITMQLLEETDYRLSFNIM